jgi:phosphoribosylglycinamide formyltransferase-1
MANIAIFASGSGSNAEEIIKFFKGTDNTVSLVITNRREAGVIERAAALGVVTHYFSKQEFEQCESVIQLLKNHHIDLIVLAGFLLKITPPLIAAFPYRIVNLHPSLLPKYGGKGMYGAHVHKAVLAAGEAESGITIHLVNEHFDEGRILAQHRVAIDKEDDVSTLSKKIQVLEHNHFPKAIKNYLSELV